MTDTNNEWIEKAYKAYKENIPNYINPIDSFKKAIEDNLPQSISREAVEKLREKYDKLGDLFYEDEGSILHRINPIKDIDALLSNPQDDTEKV